MLASLCGACCSTESVALIKIGNNRVGQYCNREFRGFESRPQGRGLQKLT